MGVENQYSISSPPRTPPRGGRNAVSVSKFSMTPPPKTFKSFVRGAISGAKEALHRSEKKKTLALGSSPTKARPLTYASTPKKHIRNVASYSFLAEESSRKVKRTPFTFRFSSRSLARSMIPTPSKPFPAPPINIKGHPPTVRVLSPSSSFALHQRASWVNLTPAPSLNLNNNGRSFRDSVASLFSLSILPHSSSTSSRLNSKVNTSKGVRRVRSALEFSHTAQSPSTTSFVEFNSWFIKDPDHVIDIVVAVDEYSKAMLFDEEDEGDRKSNGVADGEENGKPRLSGENNNNMEIGGHPAFAFKAISKRNGIIGMPVATAETPTKKSVNPRFSIATSMRGKRRESLRIPPPIRIIPADDVPSQETVQVNSPTSPTDTLSPTGIIRATPEYERDDYFSMNEWPRSTLLFAYSPLSEYLKPMPMCTALYDAKKSSDSRPAIGSPPPTPTKETYETLKPPTTPASLSFSDTDTSSCPESELSSFLLSPPRPAQVTVEIREATADEDESCGYLGKAELARKATLKLEKWRSAIEF